MVSRARSENWNPWRTWPQCQRISWSPSSPQPCTPLSECGFSILPYSYTFQPSNLHQDPCYLYIYRNISFLLLSNKRIFDLETLQVNDTQVSLLCVKCFRLFMKHKFVKIQILNKFHHFQIFLLLQNSEKIFARGSTSVMLIRKVSSVNVLLLGRNKKLEFCHNFPRLKPVAIPEDR